MRQLRHSCHVISIKRVAFDVADSAFYNIHMKECLNCRTLVGPPLLVSRLYHISLASYVDLVLYLWVNGVNKQLHSCNM